jgi:hypothetical protein
MLHLTGSCLYDRTGKLVTLRSLEALVSIYQIARCHNLVLEVDNMNVRARFI